MVLNDNAYSNSLLIKEFARTYKDTNVSGTTASATQQQQWQEAANSGHYYMNDGYNIDGKRCRALGGWNEENLFHFSHSLLAFTNVKKDHSDTS